MLLWEVSKNHDLNDYQLCEYHNIKSGIILHGREAYIFTQITNNDIQSNVKILFRGQILPKNISPGGAAKMIVKYVRYNVSRMIIPSMPSIQHDMYQTIGITDVNFHNDPQSYLTLLHRIYLLTFTIHLQNATTKKKLAW